MVDLYEHYDTPLCDETLYSWHRMLLEGTEDISVIGGYRTHDDPMQVVSGPSYKRVVHFEAPPSERMPEEMASFLDWLANTAPTGSAPLPALTRAGIAHLYFVCIHPFEDGNGRIGRAIAEKSLAENLGHPTLIALAYTIAHKRKDYYAALEHNNQDLEITEWLDYFCRTILDAQTNTIKRIDFFVAKAKFYERHCNHLNERQSKVIARLFEEGIDGFKGGLSADNYITITKASRATTTRDLQDLVEKGALTRTGELRYTRYSLAI
jgi:Fic family protein